MAAEWLIGMVKWLVCTTEWLVGDYSQNSVLLKQSSRFFRAEVKAIIISSPSQESPLSRSWRLVPDEVLTRSINTRQRIRLSSVMSVEWRDDGMAKEGIPGYE